MKKFGSAVLAGCMALSLAACGNSASSASTASTGGASEGSNGTTVIKIGGIGPVTGAAAVYGNAVKLGAEIAVEEINAKGVIQY